MTPREEIRSTGRLGREGAALVYRLVRLVAVSRNFPPPPGSTYWDQTSVTETAHDLLAGQRGAKRVLDVAARSVDDDGFERMMEGAVVNFLRDVARRTDTGRLVRRVAEVLTDEPGFELVPGSPSRWTLAGGPSDPSTVPAPVLARAAASEPDVVVPEWRSADRNRPFADKATLVRLLERVLRAARGSLGAADAAIAVAARLDPARVPLTVEVQVLERVAERSRYAGDPASFVATELRAREIFDALDDQERIAVATFDRNVRDLEVVLGLRKTQAALFRQRLTGRLGGELAGEEAADDTVETLAGLCASWLEERTSDGGPTFQSTIETTGGPTHERTHTPASWRDQAR